MVAQEVKYFQVDLDTKRSKSLGVLAIAKINRRVKERLSLEPFQMFKSAG